MRFLLFVSHITGLVIFTVFAALPDVSAAQLPSLFRGVVVADSSLGVRVISVDEESQASLGDLRPEDLIVRVDDTDVRSIDEFATASLALKGKAISAALLVFRNGAPLTLSLTLNSYPLMNGWNIEFVPNYEFHFAEAAVGRDYWFRLGRGFEGAEKLPEALDAFLNGLHNLPNDSELGLRCALMWSRIGQGQLHQNQLAEGLASLNKSIVMMQMLFDTPLSDEQLLSIKQQLQSTVAAIRTVKAKGFKAAP